jgi:hypothetical protein
MNKTSGNEKPGIVAEQELCHGILLNSARREMIRPLTVPKHRPKKPWQGMKERKKAWQDFQDNSRLSAEQSSRSTRERGAPCIDGFRQLLNEKPVVKKEKGALPTRWELR